jgi:hypothetical protein
MLYVMFVVVLDRETAKRNKRNPGEKILGEKRLLHNRSVAYTLTVITLSESQITLFLVVHLLNA